MTPAECRAHGEKMANRAEWGESPPLWHTAATQADWEAEAYLMEIEMRNGDYAAFLDSKSHSGNRAGFAPVFAPSFLFDFQAALLDWSVRAGRCAIFADCGLGKTPLQLCWAENVYRHTNKPVLILTPLAVAPQTVREGEKFGIEVRRSHRGEVHHGLNVTNYERLSHFDPNDFAGVVCDESSILKSFDGVRRGEITAFMRKVEYRLLCTATAAPNDYTELGTSSEALGGLGHVDMLGKFFRNDNKTIDMKGQYRGFHAPREWRGPQWRFKGHAELPFWKWVCSWARACRKPSDLGFDDGDFRLPPIDFRQHVVEARTLAPGLLFALPALGMREQREERRRTINERCEKVGELVNHDRPSLIWCHLNPEGDLLEQLIPGAVQVSGKDSDEAKEEKLLGFIDGSIKDLITKPKIGAWGLNFQHCAHVLGFPSHSFEQFYQGVRRCWRFGQTRTVTYDMVTTEGERDVLENLRRKERAADQMFARLVALMNEGMKVDHGHKFTEREEVPSWL